MTKEYALREAMRLDWKLSREKPARLFWPKPVLTEHQWEAHRLLSERLSPDRWHLFAGSLLSHFFNPDDFAHDRNLYQLVKSTPVLFVVATKAPDCRAVLIILAQSNTTVEAFLDKEEVHWMRYATQLSPEEFVDHVGLALRDGSGKVIGNREPINDSENKAAQGFRTGRMIDQIKVHDLEQYLEEGISAKEAQRWLIDRSPCLLHEVALQVMEPGFPLRWTNFEKSMLKLSSVDLLFHDRGSLNRPLLAVEIDGPPHREKVQQEKDKVKDELLQGMGIPLIRISIDDAQYLWIEQNAHKYGTKLSPSKQRQLEDDLKHFGRFFGHIAGIICSQVRLESKEEITLNEANVNLAKIQENISRSLYKKDYIDLNDQQQDCVDESLLESKEAYANYDAQKNYADLIDQELQRAKEYSEWPIDLQKITTQPEMLGDMISGLKARVVLTTPKRATIPVETPTIKLSANFLEANLLNANVKHALFSCLEHKARHYLKAQIA